MRSTEPRAALAHAGWQPWERRNDRGALAWALGVAVGFHLLFLLIDLPDREVYIPLPSFDESPLVRPTEIPLPPPRPSEELRGPTERTHLTPVPFPPEVPPEPVPERASAIDIDSEPIEMAVDFGDPQPPPSSPGPHRPGENDVTFPVLVPKSKVSPDYPELPRAARIEGRVILQAVIGSDGRVLDVEVLQCLPPDFGFEQAAIEAIRQWRYEPARQHGRPVDVYFTVVVTFELR